METEYRRRYVELTALGLVVVGLGMVVAGWLGLEDQRSVVEQLPYLASGGIGGLTVVVAGAALVHLTRQFRLERTVADLAIAQEELQASLDRFVAALGNELDLRVPLAAAQNHRSTRRTTAGAAASFPMLSASEPEG